MLRLFCLIIIAFYDIKNLEICQPMLWMLFFLSACCGADSGTGGLLAAVIIWAAYLLTAVLCTLLSRDMPIGMGDIRLFSVLALGCGLYGIFRIFCVAGLLAGAVCALLLITKRLSAGDRIPYAPFICAGYLFCLCT